MAAMPRRPVWVLAALFLGALHVAEGKVCAPNTCGPECTSCPPGSSLTTKTMSEDWDGLKREARELTNCCAPLATRKTHARPPYTLPSRAYARARVNRWARFSRGPVRVRAHHIRARRAGPRQGKHVPAALFPKPLFPAHHVATCIAAFPCLQGASPLGLRERVVAAFCLRALDHVNCRSRVRACTHACGARPAITAVLGAGCLAWRTA